MYCRDQPRFSGPGTRCLTGCQQGWQHTLAGRGTGLEHTGTNRPAAVLTWGNFLAFQPEARLFRRIPGGQSRVSMSNSAIP